MNDTLVRQVADQILREGFLENWRFYTILAGISFVATILGAWTSSYVKRRGETLATKADMAEILRQVESTTKATEQVKLSLSHSDWVAREWRTLRKTKLEQLLSAAYRLDQWLQEQQARWVYKESVDTQPSPLTEVRSLCILYFPELSAEAQELFETYGSANAFLLDIARKINAANSAKDIGAYELAMSAFVEGWKSLYPPAHAAVLKLESKAAKVIQEFAGA